MQMWVFALVVTSLSVRRVAGDDSPSFDRNRDEPFRMAEDDRPQRPDDDAAERADDTNRAPSRPAGDDDQLGAE